MALSTDDTVRELLRGFLNGNDSAGDILLLMLERETASYLSDDVRALVELFDPVDRPFRRHFLDHLRQENLVQVVKKRVHTPLGETAVVLTERPRKTSSAKEPTYPSFGDILAILPYFLQGYQAVLGKHLRKLLGRVATLAVWTGRWTVSSTLTFWSKLVAKEWDKHIENCLMPYRSREDRVGESLMYLRLGKEALTSNMIEEARACFIEAKRIAHNEGCVEVKAIAIDELSRFTYSAFGM